MTRFLVTTALEESWPDDRPVLFLGEWCRRYSRSERWSKIPAEMLPYHWDDRAQLYADYQHLQQLYEQILAELSVQLNHLHQTGHSLRYWRMLVGPWLGYFIPMAFDRWSCVQRAVAVTGVTETIVLTGPREAPHDMEDFIRLFIEDEWNHELCADIIREFTALKCIERARGAGAANPAAVPASSWKRGVQRKLADWYARAAGRFAGKRDVFLLATYLPAGQEMELHLRLGQVPQVWRPIAPVRSRFDARQRTWTLPGAAASGFEACVRRFIPRQLPILYLEGYAALIRQAARLPWPARPKAIWTSNSESADDLFKTWAAEKIEQGSPLVIGQHGGHYGLGRWSFGEDHQMAICDRYFSWGWNDRPGGKIVPLGQLKAKRPLGVCHARQPGLLLVTAVHPRLSYMMYSTPIAGQWLEYLADQYRFVEHLPAPVRAALTVRLYPQDFGWDQRARWQDRFPALTVDEGGRPLEALIVRSRIYVSTYNATTFLESLTMDVPTVIYWNPAHWEMRVAAEPFFAALQEAGVFHTDPASAARHVAAVWEDVEAWWQSAAVQNARRTFMDRYCRRPDNLLDQVESALRRVMASSEDPARG